MKKYRVYDLYEGQKQVIGHADNKREIRKIAVDYLWETSGECDIVYAELNPQTNKYKFSQFTQFYFTDKEFEKLAEAL